MASTPREDLTWQDGRLWVIRSLVIFHIILVVLVATIYYNPEPNDTIEAMFSSCCTAITWGLGILLTGKAVKDFGPEFLQHKAAAAASPKETAQ